MKLRLPRWMYPGMHLKRWLVLMVLGVTLLGLGAAVLIVVSYRRLPEDSFIFALTGAGLDRAIRGALFAVAGLALIGVGIWGLMRSMISPFVARGDSVMEVLYTKRYLARGPRIVAIGGGTGLSVLLRGLKG